MSVGDLVRCIVSGRQGVVLHIPRTLRYTCIKPSGFIVVLWPEGRQTVHINNVETISEAG